MPNDNLAAPRPELTPVAPILVDLPTAAAMLSISGRTLHTKVKENAVPFVRIGNRLLFSPSALNEWVANGCRMVSTPAETK